MILRIQHSKRDQEGKGADVGIAFGSGPETCPVAALRTWLECGKVRYGPVFRSVTAAGTVGRGLSAHSVWKILRRRAAVGLAVHDTERLSPHGLRAGFITEAYLERRARRAGRAPRPAERPGDHEGYRCHAKTIAASPTKPVTCEAAPPRRGRSPCRGA